MPPSNRTSALAISLYCFLFAIAVFAGCSDGETPAGEDAGLAGDVAPGCPGELESCDDICVDTERDERHCGSCGMSCDDGETCVDGTCDTYCPPGQQHCENGCFDLSTSPDHCGNCGSACAVGQVCSDGSCAVSCGGDFEACDGICRDTSVDPNHCGGCEAACDIGEVCSNGACQLFCGDGLSDCGGSCRNLSGDPDHCGDCDNHCPVSSACVDGGCHPIDDYPSSFDGLEMWLRADRGMSLDGDDVTGWSNDMDTEQRAMPGQGAAPQLVDNGPGGNPVVRFDGDSAALYVDDYSYPSNAFTHIFSFLPDGQFDGRSDRSMTLYLGDETAASTQLHITLNADGDGRLGIYTMVDGEVSGSFKSDKDRWYRGHPYVVSFTYDEGDIEVYINGELDHAGSLSGSLQWQSGFSLGIGPDGEGFAGDLAEMKIFDRVLSQYELDAIHSYAMARYHLYFEGASWIDDHGDDGDFITTYELAEQSFLRGAFETLPAAESCDEHLDEGQDRDGVYPLIADDGGPPAITYCDMHRDGGGWTQIAHVKQRPDMPSPGREYATNDPHYPGHSIDAHGINFSEIALTHNGLDDGDFATFDLPATTLWNSTDSDSRFRLDNDHYAIFFLSEEESGGFGDIPATCIDSATPDCLDVERDATYGAVSSGTGNCMQLNRSTTDTCGGWGSQPHAGDTNWTVDGGRILLR